MLLAVLTLPSLLVQSHVIRVQNLCLRPVYAHLFLFPGRGVANATLSLIQAGAWADFVLSTSPGSDEISFVVWVDNSPLAYMHPRAIIGSLVESTIEETARIVRTDISIIDAFSNTWTVTPPAGCTNVSDDMPCDPILCSPPARWSCPTPNKASESSRVSTMLHAETCLSNCTLLDSDEACCRGLFDEPGICRNHSPALKVACPQSYSYAYDDHTSMFVWSWRYQSANPLLLLQACT